jgi:hypothetical protein
MKLFISFVFGTLCMLSLTTLASAQVYYSYDGVYAPLYQTTYNGTQEYYNQNYNRSYSYTSGCYTYYYNGQTNTTSVQSYNCQTNNNYTQVVTKQPVIYYTEPTVTYHTTPPTTYYTQPTVTNTYVPLSQIAYRNQYYQYQTIPSAPNYYPTYQTEYVTPNSYFCFSLYGVSACY